MKTPVITLAIESHHNNLLARMSFEYDHARINSTMTPKETAWSQSQTFRYTGKDCFKEAFANHNLKIGMDLKKFLKIKKTGGLA
jgi:hypothetical protein